MALSWPLKIALSWLIYIVIVLSWLLNGYYLISDIDADFPDVIEPHHSTNVQIAYIIVHISLFNNDFNVHEVRKNSRFKIFFDSKALR